MASTLKFDEWQSTAGISRQTILQVKQTHLDGRYSQSAPANSSIDITDFSVTITPQSVASRILIMVRWFGEYGAQDSIYNGIWGLKRNGTIIGAANSPGATLPYGITTAAVSYEASDANSTPETMNMFYVDSPATVSPTTYQVYLWQNNSTTLYTNRTVGWTGQSSGYELGTSNITVMEISA